MTVSRVVHGGTSVKEETRKRIVEAMIRLGYVPSAAAQALRSNKDLTISPSSLFALIFGSGTEYSVSFFHDITRGVEKAALELKLCPVYISIYKDMEELWMRLQGLFSAYSLSGALLVGQFTPEIIQFIRENVKNIVMVDGPAQSGEGIGVVESGNMEGSLLALDHLISLGCRKIKIITVEQNHYFARAMTMAAKIRRSKDVDIELWYNCDSCEKAEELVMTNWNNGNHFDGLYSNDDFAIGAMKALQTLNIKIPKDVKIVGFDDILYASFTVPPLTSVRIDKYLLGSEAVHTLVAISKASNKAENITKVIRPSLIIRGSA
ncbi:putative Transcriptional regulator, LacI family [uncultured spirochete]|uniref:Putative Transcriptional regulator, LacI family n=1 Tax=uncultured spirochete TaxID=156406 RepID=A0A3P3XR86_9SPIR|nr:putative Transcriptional regulator, LacI family [uncultured spirochete]